MGAWASLFESDPRACPRCGEPFEALSTWGPDATCSACSTLRWQEQLAAINADRHFQVESIGGGCPTQAAGRTADDRPFYFRARHGEWSLELGGIGWPTDYCAWPNEPAVLEVEGDDPSGGMMEDDEVLAVLDANLPRHLIIQERPTGVHP